MTTAAVVLAAGGGRRFEGPTHKLLAPYRGAPLVAAALDAALAAGADATAVVEGAVDLAGIVPSQMTRLQNPDWASGLSSSLRVAIDWCRAEGHDAVVIGLGDMPGVPASAWKALVTADAEVAVASFGGDLRPPVRLAASVWGELPDSGDVGARALWKRPGTIEVQCEGSPVDVDTAEDLDALSVIDTTADHLTHLDAHGHAFMVDVTYKATTAREAAVRCVVSHVANTVSDLATRRVATETSVLEAARLAGLGAAKQTSQLIPLCHPLPLDDLDVAFSLGEDVIEVHARAATHAQTGVEMEALTACAVAAVTLLGACRPLDPLATMEGLTLFEKRGGRSGTWRRVPDGALTHSAATDLPDGGGR